MHAYIHRCLHELLHTYIYTSMHACMCTERHADRQTDRQTDRWMYVCATAYTCILYVNIACHLYTYTYIYIYMKEYIHIYIYTYIHIYIYTYIHIYIYISSKDRLDHKVHSLDHAHFRSQAFVAMCIKAPPRGSSCLHRSLCASITDDYLTLNAAKLCWRECKAA